MEIKQKSFGKIKEMLTRDQMKKIKGGTSYACCQDGGGNCSSCAYQNNEICPSGSHLEACS